MTTKSPSRDTTESIPGTSPTRAAEETLDLGLVNAAVASLALTYGLVAWVELHSCLAVVGIIGADAVFVFLVVPHLIAYWLGYDVDVLLSGQSSASK
ncbi:hypothetical protein [Salarchaeum sp. JOR-1]|uniref:hypothetical protein n=1 Tax=Salarchaeum sp. JOR-1 TaxID=2599399 RepID=UPI001198526F|nr:hypothetical protein [Salarchaeum sp. JOR-1]QDX40833.1 hypothetical protein FQU85_07930 [Salarchaeum sp. JOR-1]